MTALVATETAPGAARVEFSAASAALAREAESEAPRSVRVSAASPSPSSTSCTDTTIAAIASVPDGDGVGSSAPADGVRAALMSALTRHALRVAVGEAAALGVVVARSVAAALARADADCAELATGECDVGEPSVAVALALAESARDAVASVDGEVLLRAPSVADACADALPLAELLGGGDHARELEQLADTLALSSALREVLVLGVTECDKVVADEGERLAAVDADTEVDAHVLGDGDGSGDVDSIAVTDTRPVADAPALPDALPPLDAVALVDKVADMQSVVEPEARALFDTLPDADALGEKRLDDDDARSGLGESEPLDVGEKETAHCDAPGSEKVPTAQAVQLLMLTAPARAQKVFAGHATQLALSA
jgi:hypothetical protein